MLQIEHLSFDVRDDGRQAEILSDISFNVADGEMLVITGPNGGGKSTLSLMAASALAKHYFKRRRHYRPLHQ